MKDNGRHLSGAQCDRLEKLFEEASVHSRLAGVHKIPKFHMSRHLGDLARKAGNPRFFSEAADESHNREIIAVAQASSSPIFDKNILAREQLSARLQRRT